MKRWNQKNRSMKKGEVFMRIIEYFEQTSEMQKILREQIVQGDWRAAKYLFEVLEKGQLKERSEKYGFVFLKMLHTVWGEETQVFEMELRDERNSCDCNIRKGGR